MCACMHVCNVYVYIGVCMHTHVGMLGIVGFSLSYMYICNQCVCTASMFLRTCT